MTTRVALMVPGPGHDPVKLLTQDLNSDGEWVTVADVVISIGHLIDGLYVHSHRRYIIEEL